MSFARHRASIVVAATVAVVVAVVALGAAGLVQRYRAAEQRLADIAPRHARLLGLRQADGQLDQRLAEATAALARLGHRADRDAAQLGNDLQQRVRRVLDGPGLSLNATQVAPMRSERGVGRIGVAVQAEAPLDTLQAALARLQAESPRLAVQELQVQPTPRVAANGQPVVAFRLVVETLRVDA